MAKFQIFTDSCSDLSTEDRQLYGVDYVRMNIVVDGVEMPADLDWKAYKPEEFYGWLAEGKRVKTTQVPLTEFIDRFTPVLEKGMDILYIACSSALSGSINIFELAKQELLEKFPDRKIIGVDSLCGSVTQGMCVIMAALKQQEGASIDEVAEYTLSIRNNFIQLATVETLSYLKEAGRIKASKAIMGNLFHKKPIFISDAHGNNYTLGTVTGTKNADNELVKGLKERLLKDKCNIIYIGQGMAQERAEKMKARLLEEIENIEVRIRWIGPIVGTTCGPGVFAVFGYSKEITVFDGDGKTPGIDYSKL